MNEDYVSDEYTEKFNLGRGNRQKTVKKERESTEKVI